MLTVDDTGGKPWEGRQGVVTELLDEVKCDPARTFAVACGPPVFYKFVLEKLVASGFGKDRKFACPMRSQHYRSPIRMRRAMTASSRYGPEGRQSRRPRCCCPAQRCLIRRSVMSLTTTGHCA